MNKRMISLDDIISNEEYGNIRSSKRKEMIELKKFRRLDIGPVASLYFESKETMIYQIQEMAFVEKNMICEGGSRGGRDSRSGVHPDQGGAVI